MDTSKIDDYMREKHKAKRTTDFSPIKFNGADLMAVYVNDDPSKFTVFTESNGSFMIYELTDTFEE